MFLDRRICKCIFPNISSKMHIFTSSCSKCVNTNYFPESSYSNFHDDNKYYRVIVCKRYYKIKISVRFSFYQSEFAMPCNQSKIQI